MVTQKIKTTQTTITKKILSVMLSALLIFSVTCLFACSGVGLNDKDTWTVMIYMCGSDLESQDAQGTENLQELESAAYDKDVNFVIEAGGSKKWHNNLVSNDKITRLSKTDQGIHVEETLPQANMAEENTLESFVSWAKGKFPAKHTALVLWDHGGGSINGVCSDENYNNQALQISDIKQALDKTKTNNKLDFFAVDACLMANFEFSTNLTDYSEAFYASEDAEPENGWNYATAYEDISKDKSASPTELGKKLSKSYYDNCVKHNEANECMFTVVDLSCMEQARQSFDAACADLLSSTSNAEIKAAVSASQAFPDKTKPASNEPDTTNVFDLYSMFSKLSAKTPSINKAMQDLQACIVSLQGSPAYPDAHGLSIYFPLNLTENYEKDYQLFCNISPSESYNKILNNYIQDEYAQIMAS